MSSDIDNLLKEKNIKIKYDKALDYIFNYLINEKKIYQMCDFKNGKCIANRLNKSVHDCNGCCYNYKKGLCKYLKDNSCSIDCISCKLFICSYLEKEYGRINLNKIPYVKSIFNRKQREILKRSFFKDKKEIIELLIKNK